MHTQHHSIVISYLHKPPWRLRYSTSLWIWPRVLMTPMLTFSVECRETKHGEAVYIVGSVPELGS